MVDKALFLFFLFLPFQFALNPADGIDLAVARVVVLCIGAMFLCERFRFGSWILPKWTALFSMIGFLFIAGISFLWAEEPIWSGRKIFFILSFLPLWFIVTDRLYRGGEQVARFFAKGFFFGSVSMAGVALLQFLSQFMFSLDEVLAFWLTRIYPIFLGEAFSQSVATHPSLLVNIGGETILRAVGVFPDPHVAAFYFGMTIPFGIWLSLVSKQEERRWFLLGSVVLFIADLCTFSRGGYMGLLTMAGSLVAFTMYHYRTKIDSEWMRKVFFGIALLFLVSVAVPPARERLIDTFSSSEGSNRARITLWKEAVDHISNRAWFGYGLGNYPLVVKPSAQYRDPIYIHNTYLDIWAEIGVVGLFFFLLVFLFPVGRFFFQGSFSSVSFPSFLAITVFLGHSMFENILFSVHIFPILLFLLAIVSCYPQTKQMQ